MDKNYNRVQKERLIDRLEKFISSGFGKFRNNEKVVYLVGKLVEYLK